MNNTNKIQFEKPDLAELTKQHTVVDLHFHSKHSDGMNTVKAIAKRAQELGIGVAITDHNEIRGAVEIDAYKKIFSIPGIEITSKEGAHILVYFYDIQSLKHFYKNDIIPHMGNDLMSSLSLNMESIVERARAYETVIIFPHPYCAAYTGIFNLFFSKERINRLLDAVDGVEVINSENLNKWNLRSSVLGFNLDKGITGGSDGHRLYQMGKVVSYAVCKKDRRKFLDAIKEKKTKVIGKEIDIFRKVTSNGLKLKSNLKNYQDVVGKNIRYSYKVINTKSKTLKDNVKRSLNGKIRNR